MRIALRRRDLRGFARHRICARGHDHGRSGMAGCNRGVAVVAVVGAIAGERRHRSIHLVEQGTNLRAVVGILVGQHRSDDPAGIGVRREMQPSPGPAPLGAVLLGEPLARATELQPRAVHQQVHRLAPRLWSWHPQRFSPAAQGGVVRHREIEAEQLQDRADQPLGLAKRQAEYGPQGQRRRDRQAGVARLTAPAGARLSSPGRNCLRREPYRLSLANHAASLPIAWRLYLPLEWTADAERRAAAGIPETIGFLTKPEIALEQIRAACAAGLPRGVVLMDAGYGGNTRLREEISALELSYVAGIPPQTSVWPPGTAPLPPLPWSGRS